MYRIKGVARLDCDMQFNRILDGVLNSDGSTPTNEQLFEQAKMKIHMNGKNVIFPRRGFQSCIIQGAKMGNLKEGRRGLADFIKATVLPEEDIRFDAETYDYIKKDIFPNKQGKLITVFRPCLKAGHKFTFSLLVIEDKRKSEAIGLAVDAGGLLVGLGSRRPEFGRFTVIEWKVIKKGNEG